jgi:hypothetical protein
VGTLTRGNVEGFLFILHRSFLFVLHRIAFMFWIVSRTVFRDHPIVHLQCHLQRRLFQVYGMTPDSYGRNDGCSSLDPPPPHPRPRPRHGLRCMVLVSRCGIERL